MSNQEGEKQDVHLTSDPNVHQLDIRQLKVANRQSFGLNFMKQAYRKQPQQQEVLPTSTEGPSTSDAGNISIIAMEPTYVSYTTTHDYPNDPLLGNTKCVPAVFSVLSTSDATLQTKNGSSGPSVMEDPPNVLNDNLVELGDDDLLKGLGMNTEPNIGEPGTPSGRSFHSAVHSPQSPLEIQTPTRTETTGPMTPQIRKQRSGKGSLIKWGTRYESSTDESDSEFGTENPNEERRQSDGEAKRCQTDDKKDMEQGEQDIEVSGDLVNLLPFKEKINEYFNEK